MRLNSTSRRLKRPPAYTHHQPTNPTESPSNAQAGVPFFYCSGSDFVELFVGRGAARMRALFKEAAAAAPCIIFVDEVCATRTKEARD
eukprot:2268562-Prymnesium_polylepis.1